MKARRPGRRVDVCDVTEGLVSRAECVHTRTRRQVDRLAVAPTEFVGTSRSSADTGRVSAERLPMEAWRVSEAAAAAVAAAAKSHLLHCPVLLQQSKRAKCISFILFIYFKECSCFHNV